MAWRASWASRPTRRSPTATCTAPITDRNRWRATAKKCCTNVVPLVAKLLQARRAEHGWDRLRFWDEALIDPAGNPKPVGDYDHQVRQAEVMFDRMHPQLADFYRMLRDGGFMDLKNRPGKAGGGFCTAFPTQGVPFIFANFNGTHHDIGRLHP